MVYKLVTGEQEGRKQTMHMIVVNERPKKRENKYSRYIQTEWCDVGNVQSGLGGVVGWGVLREGGERRGGERY